MVQNIRNLTQYTQFLHFTKQFGDFTDVLFIIMFYDLFNITYLFDITLKRIKEKI